MAEDRMTESYTLDLSGINEAIDRVAPGVYAIGKTYWSTSETNLFSVRRVGRSDQDLKGSLIERAKEYHGFPFPYRFLFQYCASAQEAFALECELYHDYEPRDNAYHPTPPARSGWACPRCKLVR